jgi:capsular polysaccharide export protein
LKGYIYYINNFIQIFTNKNFRGWGLKKTGRFSLWCKKKFGGDVTLLEDGFIRSLGLGVENSPSFSVVEDSVGIYYDATKASELENILNTYDFSSNVELMGVAKEAMRLIREEHISKYNNAPNISNNYFENDSRSRVLIVAQTYGDASLEYGLGNLFSTQNIIDNAISENPEASIYIKIHPDVLSAKKKSDIKVDEIPKSCKIIDENINPISLLKYFDKVYTKTSAMGMEALILGKEVICYGMPFYAGWGNVKIGIEHSKLEVNTILQSTIKRRARKLSVEELFAGAYILYTKYYNPYRNRPSDILDTIREILLQRNKMKYEEKIWLK